VRQKTRWQSSEIWMDVIRCAHTPDIELRFRINWQEKRQILKLELPTVLSDASVRAKMPAESVERPGDGLEYPCHDWLALEGQIAGKPAAIGLINDSSYSCDAKDGRLRMILTRSVAHAEHPPFEYKDDRNIPFLDQGWQERRFLLVAGENLESLQLERKAQEFQIPAQHMLDSGHPGTEPWQQSLFSVEPSNISTLALKAAETGGASIVRLLETQGRPTEATLRYRGAEWKLPLKAHQLVTYRLSENAAPQPVNGLER
jgi:alpha-mannosidase